MSGLMRRLTRRRAAEPAAGPPGAPTADSSEPSLLEDPARAPSEGATEELPVVERPGPAGQDAAPPDDLPAGLDPAELEAIPDTSARRGKLRRRLEFLRSAREVLLRDLGGFVLELHRTARDSEQEGHRRLRAAKLARLDAVEAELHDLERRLQDPRSRTVVREPGVGGECHRCGELFGSSANYCAHCGAPLTESARRARHKSERADGGEPEPGTAGPAPAAAEPAPPGAAEPPHATPQRNGAAPDAPTRTQPKTGEHSSPRP